MSERATPAIDTVVRRLVERFDPEQIILFGSQATGASRHDSDIDLLVIMPYTGSKRQRQLEMRIALDDLLVGTDIILASPDEVRRHRNVVGTLIRPALREGKVLYARTG